VAIWYEVVFDGATANPDSRHHSLEEAKRIGYARLGEHAAEAFTVFEVDDRNGVSAVAAMHSVFDSRVSR
jgi:hypothetical protein